MVEQDVCDALCGSDTLFSLLNCITFGMLKPVGKEEHERSPTDACLLEVSVLNKLDTSCKNFVLWKRFFHQKTLRRAEFAVTALINMSTQRPESREELEKLGKGQYTRFDCVHLICS